MLLLPHAAIAQAPQEPIAQLLARHDTDRIDTGQLGLEMQLIDALFGTEQAWRHLDHAERTAQRLMASDDQGLRDMAARARPYLLSLRALHYQQQQKAPDAVRTFELGWQAAEALGDTHAMILLANNYGLLLAELTERSKALAQYRRALALAESKGGVWPVSLHARMGDLFTDMDLMDSAEAHLATSFRLDPGPDDYRLYMLAELRTAQHRDDEAILLFDSALVLARAISNHLTVANAYERSAFVLLRNGRLHEALDQLDSCVRYTERHTIEVRRCRCLRERGRVRLELHDKGDAEDDLLAVMAIAGDQGLWKDRQVAAELLKDLYKDQGRLREALGMAEAWKEAGDSATARSAREDILRSEFRTTLHTDSLENAMRREQDQRTAEAERQRHRMQRNALLGFGVFALAFALVFLTQRNRISRARKRSDELLLNILPAEVAEELKDTGTAKARHFDRATILFTDFKGFTQLSEQVTPAELVDELNTCFKAFDAIMEGHRIEKIKTIGDAYMAAGGLPDPAQGSASDVVRAALEMQAFMAKHKAERQAAGRPYFEMRVGIHTGPVVAGIVGVKKFQYDIWGDTVNTASRMESSGEAGKVNISEATHQAIKEDPAFTFTPRGLVSAKGKGEMAMWFVERSA